jgi:uncharacterized FlgJ-related protein
MKIKLITSIIIFFFSIEAYSEQVPSSINTTQSISKNKTSECIFPAKTKIPEYSSVEVSVRDYYKTLSRSYAFAEFRKTKIITNNPYILVTKLDSYSEKKAAYGVELASIIKFNKYFKFDE